MKKLIVSVLISVAAAANAEDKFHNYTAENRLKFPHKVEKDSVLLIRGLIERAESTYARSVAELISVYAKTPGVRPLGESVLVYRDPNPCRANGWPVEGLSDQECGFFLYEYFFNFELQGVKYSMVVLGPGHFLKSSGTMLGVAVDRFEVRCMLDKECPWPRQRFPRHRSEKAGE